MPNAIAEQLVSISLSMEAFLHRIPARAAHRVESCFQHGEGKYDP
jgi:hypothetical protein